MKEFMLRLITIIFVFVSSAASTWYVAKDFYYNLGVEHTLDVAVEFIEENKEQSTLDGFDNGYNAAQSFMKDVCDRRTLFKFIENGEMYLCVSESYLKEQMKQSAPPPAYNGKGQRYNTTY
jgi:hypothetical protein